MLDRRGRWIAGDAVGNSRVPHSVKEGGKAKGEGKGKRRQDEVDPSPSPRRDLDFGRDDEQVSVAETELDPVEEEESTPRPKKKRKYKHHIPSDGPSSPFKPSSSSASDGLGLPSSVRTHFSLVSHLLIAMLTKT